MNRFLKTSINFLNLKTAFAFAVILFFAIGAGHGLTAMLMPSTSAVAVESVSNSLCDDPLPQDDSQASIVDRCRQLVNIFRNPVRRNIVPRVPVDCAVPMPVIRSWDITAAYTVHYQSEYIFVFVHHLHRALPMRAGPIEA